MNKTRTLFLAVLGVILCGWLGWTVLARAEDSVSNPISWRTNYDAALEEAKKENKLLFVDFHATWCGPCAMMDRTTFRNEKVVARLTEFVPLKIDVDRQPEVAGKYGITSMPTLALLRSDGSPIAGASGYHDEGELLALVDKIIATDYGATTGKSKYGIEGKLAPPLGVSTWFNLPEGRDKVEITDYRGKVVYLLTFQSWCPGCHKVGFPTLAKVMEHYDGNDRVAFLALQTTFEGFSSNGPDGARRTAERYGLTIPVGHSGSSSEPPAMMQRYRTGGTPWVAIIGPDGIVKYNDFHLTEEAAITMIDGLIAEVAAKP